MGRKKQATRCLYGKRVMLRSLVPDDFNQWREVRTKNHDWLVRWEPTRDYRGNDEYADKGVFYSRCEAWENEWQQGRGHQFGVFLLDQEEAGDNGSSLRKRKKGEKFIGELNLTSIQRGVFQNCSLGYWIDERHAGNGFIPEAVAVVLKFVFEDMNLHRAQISIVPRNAPSLRVVEKLNLRQEGMAERYLEIYGKWEDHNIFAITVEEYLERKADLSSKWLEPS